MPAKFSLDKFREKDDAVMPPGDGCENDIVIPILGQTGAGKSTFVNNVLGRAEAEVSDGYNSCTRRLNHYIVDPSPELAEESVIKGQRIVLVDTPGFNDTELSDMEILRRIAVWLASSYDSKMKIGGVVYICPIYPTNPMTSGEVRVYQKMCGKLGSSVVTLATTRWDLCPPENREKRGRECMNTFWSVMSPESDPEDETKAGMTKLCNNKESAWNVIKDVLKRRADVEINGVILKLQEEIVDKRMEFEDTAAARELRGKLDKLHKESGKVMPSMRLERLRSLASEMMARLKLSISSLLRRYLGFTS